LVVTFWQNTSQIGKLSVIFHFIDGRHGPIDEDDNIMRQISESKPNSVQYVIVLTKADKNVKGASTGNGGKVSSAILEKVRKVLASEGK
jgi:Predicted GTPase